MLAGFALAALLSYKNLELPANRSFQELTEFTKDGVEPSFKLSSTVVSVVVSNPSTQNLSRPVNITFTHLQVVTHRLIILAKTSKDSSDRDASSASDVTLLCAEHGQVCECELHLCVLE